MGTDAPRGYNYQRLLDEDTPPPGDPQRNREPNMNRLQGYILIGITAATFLLVAWFIFRPAPKYAYKVINVQAQFSQQVPPGPSAENVAKLNGTNVNLSDEDLSVLGKEGWELVDTILEMETTHPNYGSSEYVTGLQPNIRPQRAVLLFRKQL